MQYTTRVIVALALVVCSTYAEDPWTPSPLCPFPSEDLTRFPYEGDCSKYWECYEGARYPMDCPGGLEYNANASRCDSPDLANCDPDATIIYPTFSHSTVTTLSTATTKDPGPLPECPFPSDELTFFPVINNCSQYWECFQGNRYLMTCPGELVWNVNFNYCDYRSNVDCTRNSSTSSTSTTTTTETTPTGTTESTETTSTGTTNTTVSPSETTTDSTTVTTTSQTTPTTTGTTSPTTPNPICIGQPNGAYLADPYDCTKYYECVNERATEGQCPDGLYWNVAAHSCDFPQNVACTPLTTSASSD